MFICKFLCHVLTEIFNYIPWVNSVSSYLLARAHTLHTFHDPRKDFMRNFVISTLPKASLAGKLEMGGVLQQVELSFKGRFGQFGSELKTILLVMYLLGSSCSGILCYCHDNCQVILGHRQKSRQNATQYMLDSWLCGGKIHHPQNQEECRHESKSSWIASSSA